MESEKVCSAGETADIESDCLIVRRFICLNDTTVNADEFDSVASDSAVDRQLVGGRVGIDCYLILPCIVNPVATLMVLAGKLTPVVVGQIGVETAAGDEDAVGIGPIQTAIRAIAIVRGERRHGVAQAQHL